MTEPTDDLFDAIDTLPPEIQDLIARTSDTDNDYRDIEMVKGEFEAEGYTFDYNLDGEPYNLRKLPEPSTDSALTP